MLPDEPFDEIALEYARHCANITYAQSEFHRQRDRLLEHLGQPLATASAEASLEYAGLLEDAHRTHRYTRFLGQYHKAVQTRIGKERPLRDGVWFGISTGAVRDEEEDTEVCFRADVYFRMGPQAHRRLGKTLARFTEKVPYPVRYVHRWLYIPVIRISAADETFNLANFEAAVRSLPPLFVEYDKALSEAYTAAFHSEAPEAVAPA